MNTDKTLLVLAAGMGSRYGGLKQMDPIGPNGEFILDYSVGDALAAGFSSVTFVIRKDIEKDFRQIVGCHWENKTDVRYCFQKLDDLPPSFQLPPDRQKPWGTGQAILAARDVVSGAFAVVNADDYYGPEALRLCGDYIDATAAEPDAYCMVAYRLDQTLSQFSPVSRGICSISPEGNLTDVEERLKLMRCPDGIVRDGVDAFADDAPVSMNMFGFKRSFIDKLLNTFPRFLASHGSTPKAEFQTPTALRRYIKRGEVSVKVLQTSGRWFGITAREDRPAVCEFFKTIPSPLA